ncbi:aldo/keto reductase, partial [Burkholderia multivorans]|uniref:aldo/keto reductase n=1 Tax=Burkholderia multivorans TaxID=87883 RepID=UPI002FC304FD
EQSVRAAADFDGVMLGRAAWHTPRVLSEVSLQLWPSVRLPSDAQVVDAMMEYAARQVAQARGIADIVCVQNQYNIAHRGDDALIAQLAQDGIAYVPFFPLGGFSPLQSAT